MSSALSTALNAAKPALAIANRVLGREPSLVSGPPAGWGLPHDRHARIAARRSFVALKHRFMNAVNDVTGPRADWLRFQVRQAEEPVDLWLMRGLVDDALEREGPATERTRRELREALAQMFPDNGELLPYGVRR
jgi:hypothetical protein